MKPSTRPAGLRLLLPLLSPLLPIALGACNRWQPEPLSAGALVGDSSCVSCHQDKATHFATAHARTSAPPTAETIHGSFAEGENVMTTRNPNLHYRLEAGDNGFMQTAVTRTPSSPSDSTVRTERFDVVVGSGRKGQSYLYWWNNLLFQLPVSYWVGLGWVNSPGYPDGVAYFDRPATPRCLECHSTFFATREAGGAPNAYDRESAVLGISCESCHGAGREHVERQGSWLTALRGQAIVNPAELPRERQLEGCALCHGGIGESVRPPFSYTPGAPLAEFLRLPVPDPGEPLDVHGNQVALLMRSPCFQGSAMTCATCHDVHQRQEDLAAFTPTCRGCHAPPALPAEHGANTAQTCVDCHMPNLPTDAIFTNTAGRHVQPRVRTHWIGVYPPEAVAGERQAMPVVRSER